MSRVTQQDIEEVKALARRYNAAGDHLHLNRAIGILEVIWADDHAAKAFYTELEQTAPR